ncbi:MAG: hypothetical protein JKY66_06040 [Spongiibacteraceae bacterium]|nr:hypothetical protein [Spongiibacteraceae bacterium]
MNQYKIELMETLRILSDIEAQKIFSDELTVGDPTGDLICGWFDTGFFPESENFKSLFSEYEWLILSEFNEFFDNRVKYLPEEFEKLIVNSKWIEIVMKAKATINILEDHQEN